MSDIGRFRAVDARDLARFVYGGDGRRLNTTRKPSQAGIDRGEDTSSRHRSARKLVTLTAQGERVVRQVSGLPRSKGCITVRQTEELDHDADLYKVYQRAVEEIRSRGGRPKRIRLDFELKESINRARETALGCLPPNGANGFGKRRTGRG